MPDEKTIDYQIWSKAHYNQNLLKITVFFKRFYKKKTFEIKNIKVQFVTSPRNPLCFDTLLVKMGRLRKAQKKMSPPEIIYEVVLF